MELSKSFKNMSWLVFGQIVNMLLQFFVSLLTARYLGPSNYGVINYIAAYVAFFTSVISLGVSTVVIKKISVSEDSKRNNEIIWTCNVFRLIASAISFLAIIVLVYIIDNGDLLLVRVAAISSIALFFNAFDTTNQYFIAKLLSKWYTIACLVAYISMSIYRIILLANNADVLWFAFATSLDAIVLNILLMVFYSKFEGFKPCFNWQLGKTILKQSYHYLIAGIITVLYAQIGKIILGKMAESSAVGLYSAALAIAALWGLLPSALIQSFTSVLYKTAEQSKELFLRRLRQVYAIIFWLNAAYSLFVTIFAKWILLFLYGESYLPAKNALIIVVWYYGISAFSTLNQIYLANYNCNKYIKYFCLAGLVANVVLNAVLIPVCGISGAAIATLITQLIIQIIMPALFKKTREISISIIKGAFLIDVINKQEFGELKNLIKR